MSESKHISILHYHVITKALVFFMRTFHLELINQTMPKKVKYFRCPAVNQVMSLRKYNPLKVDYMSFLLTVRQHTNIEFENLLSRYAKILENMNLTHPVFKLILGNFNSRSRQWWDENVSNKEGINLESVSTTHSFLPNSFIPNSYSFAIFI